MDDIKVLVVDDTEINLRIFEALMTPYEVGISCATSGEEAIAGMKMESQKIKDETAKELSLLFSIPEEYITSSVQQIPMAESEPKFLSGKPWKCR